MGHVNIPTIISFPNSQSRVSKLSQTHLFPISLGLANPGFLQTKKRSFPPSIPRSWPWEHETSPSTKPGMSFQWPNLYTKENQKNHPVTQCTFIFHKSHCKIPDLPFLLVNTRPPICWATIWQFKRAIENPCRVTKLELPNHVVIRCEWQGQPTTTPHRVHQNSRLTLAATGGNWYTIQPGIPPNWGFDCSFSKQRQVAAEVNRRWRAITLPLRPYAHEPAFQISTSYGGFLK